MDKHSYFKYIFQLLIVGILFLTLGVAVYSQGSVLDIRINKVDITAFPRIRVYASPINAGKVIPDLTQDDFRVYEDSAQRTVKEMEREYVGSQIAIVLDASGSFKLPGVTDHTKTRLDEAREAIDELILDTGQQWIDHKNHKDQLMLMVPTSATTFDVSQKWTHDYIKIHDAAYKTHAVDGNTPLLKMLQDSMDRMKELPDYQTRAKFLLVLSDGEDHISAQEITDVLMKADKLGITILGVKVGPNNTAAKNMQRLAEETGGAFTIYTGSNSLAPLYSLIQTQGWQYVIGYDSGIATAGDHIGQLGVEWNAIEYKSELYPIPIELLPPNVFVADPQSADTQNPEPLDGKTIDRVTDDWRTDLTDIEPKGIPVSIIVSFPDNHPRDIEQVQYEIDGKVVQKLPLNEPFFWDFTNLDQGQHHMTLVVKVIDELGLVGDSGPVNITVNVSKPAAPQKGRISGNISGGAGDRLNLIDEDGRTIASTTVSKDGTYQFTDLPEGNYVIQNTTRQQGVTEIGPFYVDGMNETVIPPEDDFGKTPITLPPSPLKNPWFWMPWVLALSALGFALYIFIRRPHVMSDMAEKVQEVTVPFVRRHSSYQPHAVLIPITDDNHPAGDPIQIAAPKVTIGRDPARTQITFSEPSVSRLHARIVENPEGIFSLNDEGSASGTYLNGELVGPKPVQLQNNDTIEFGRVKVIFQQEFSGEETEPFIERV